MEYREEFLAYHHILNHQYYETIWIIVTLYVWWLMCYLILPSHTLTLHCSPWYRPCYPPPSPFIYPDGLVPHFTDFWSSSDLDRRGFPSALVYTVTDKYGDYLELLVGELLLLLLNDKCVVAATHCKYNNVVMRKWFECWAQVSLSFSFFLLPSWM